MWPRPADRHLTFPVAVTLNRFTSPLRVFCFGMLSVPPRRKRATRMALRWEPESINETSADFPVRDEEKWRLDFGRTATQEDDASPFVVAEFAGIVRPGLFNRRPKNSLVRMTKAAQTGMFVPPISCRIVPYRRDRCSCFGADIPVCP
jgi:hypothetical protein